jgi:dipeptidyl aminopeptidase/acylaminoacyl peptidase
MTLDTRARRAAQGIHSAVEVMEMSTSTKEPRKVERFDRFRDRKQRNRRIGALVVAMLVIVTIVVATTALERRETEVPATPSPQNGRIVFGEQGPRRQGYGPSTHLFTMNPDGTDVRELRVKSSCMSWAPDGSKILIVAPTTHATVGPATINPDGTGYTELAATTDLTLGCGAFSPDGTRIVIAREVLLEPDHYNRRTHGIFTMRASDGGDLVRITPRDGTNPSYSPDGTQIVFEGVQGEHGACLPHAPPSGGTFTCPPGTDRIGELDGSIFVVNADGTGLHRIASDVGFSDSPSWSPDGRWILFSNGTGVYVVHPDGAGLRQITLEVPRLRFAFYPSWSPDGTRFVFVGVTRTEPGSNLFTALRDGTEVEQITHTHDIYYRDPDWGTNPG